MPEFKPTKKQWEALEILNDNVTTEIGYGGAAFSGKTYLGCVWETLQCLQYPGVRYGLGRKELTNLKKTTLLTLFKVFEMFNITEEGYSYNQQANIITFQNGSQIFLLDLANKPSDPLYARFGGLELTGIFIDESNECPEEAIKILRTRIGRHLNEKYGILGKSLEGFNPSKNHIYIRFYKPWKEGTMPEYRKFIPALPKDNPHVPEQYIENLKNSDKVTKERLLFGNFEYDDDPTNLFNTDALYDLFTNPIVKQSEKYITVDIARYGKDSTVIGIWEGLELKKIEVLRLHGIDEIAQYVKSLSREHMVPFSQIIADEDGVGGGVVDILRGIKGFMGGTSPFEVWNHMLNRMDRANYRNLRHQCYFKLSEMVNQRKICISDVTYQSNIIEELSVTKRKAEIFENKYEIISKDDIKTLLGRSPDFADMIMMRMYFEFKKVPPPNQFGGFQVNKSFTHKKLNQSI